MLADVFVALILLQLKHWVFDFLLQSKYMIENKGTYGKPGGLLHAASHMLGSIPALLVLTTSGAAILALVLLEGIVHYHIDWSKEQLTRRLRLAPQNPGFWYLLGFDQLLHQLTYIAMIWYIVA